LILTPTGRNFDSEQKFRFRDYRDAYTTDGKGTQPIEHMSVRALHDVGTGVRIQHVARHYRSRSCTRRSSTSSMKFADATGPSAR
jgi:hypothetical protein